MDCNESQSKAESKEKGKQLRWNYSMDTTLIDTLVEEAKQGHKHGNAWKDSVWKVVIDAIFQKTRQVVGKKHIESRLRTMKAEYKAFVELKGKNGFGWDPVKQIVTAPDEKWEELLHKYDKFKWFRGRSPKWDFEKLSIIIGNDHPNGSFAICVLDCDYIEKIDDGDGKDDPPAVDEDLNLYGTEEGVSVSNTSIGKRPIPSPQKKQQNKKARTVEAMREIIEGMNARIEQIAKLVDPMSFANTLYAELMKTEGFDSRYLDCAFAILRRDPLEAEIFLARNSESRKRMLEGLREKICDV